MNLFRTKKHLIKFKNKMWKIFMIFVLALIDSYMMIDYHSKYRPQVSWPFSFYYLHHFVRCFHCSNLIF